MPRQSKPHRVLNCKLQLDIWNQLDEYCKDTGVSKTFLVERAVGEYLEKQKKQLELIRSNQND